MKTTLSLTALLAVFVASLHGQSSSPYDPSWVWAYYHFSDHTDTTLPNISWFDDDDSDDWINLDEADAGKNPILASSMPTFTSNYVQEHSEFKVPYRYLAWTAEVGIRTRVVRVRYDTYPGEGGNIVEVSVRNVYRNLGESAVARTYNEPDDPYAEYTLFNDHIYLNRVEVYSEHEKYLLGLMGKTEQEFDIIRANSNTDFGFGNVIQGWGSAGFGIANYINALGAMASGQDNEVTANRASAFGRNLIAAHDDSFVVGRFNKVDTAAGPNDPARPLFVVGTGANSSNRSNGLVVRANGAVEIQPQGDISMGPFTSD